MATHLDVARQVAGHGGPVVGVDQRWLLDHGVQPWMGARSLPLWLPLPEYAGFSARNAGSARASGLVVRPLHETLAATLAWEIAAGADRPRQAGLSHNDERELLQELAS